MLASDLFLTEGIQANLNLGSRAAHFELKIEKYTVKYLKNFLKDYRVK